jgi:transglutaminase-like putative cysteine protease/uncharacterized protein (DUF58 family)
VSRPQGRLTGRLRPSRPWAAIPASVGVSVFWWLVARTSGQGWVQVTGEVVFGALSVGVVGPGLVLRRRRVAVVSAPADGTTGHPVELELHRSGPVRVTPLDPPGPPAFDGPVKVVPAQRGLYRAVVLELATAAPFGLQWWRREVVVDLPAPLWVAPRPVPAPVAAPTPSGPIGTGSEGASRPDPGEARGARPYLPGDRRRLVHWPASAHTGTLMVRELEAPSGPPVELAVSLPADPEAAEREAGRVLGAVLALLAAGRSVRLITDEAGGRRKRAAVADPRAARRRLAAAVPAGGDALAPTGSAEPARDGEGPGRAGNSRRRTWRERVREANAPRPPEDSTRLRLACVATVALGLGAAASQGEISWPAASTAAALVAAGTAWSHRRRRAPGGWVKLVVAAGALTATGVFVDHLRGAVGAGLSGAEGPLAAMLASILVVHSLHVPARRDLLFLLGGSSALVAIAAAAAVDLGFARWAGAWAAGGLWALVECGASAGRRRPAAGGVAAAAAGTLAVAAGAFLLLPAPRPDLSLELHAAAGSGGAVPVPGALAGDRGQPTALSRPGSIAGPTRVGGYLGFAGALDTAVRAQLGHQVVMLVRATVPSFWVGETYDRWDGTSWSSTLGQAATLTGSSPFQVSQPGAGRGAPDVQTFYIEQATADLVFHAGAAQQVWLAADRLYAGPDGSLISPIALGRGAIYTVESSLSEPAVPDLEAAGRPASFPATLAPYLALPRPYTEVAALARSVTAGDATEYAEVQSLIAWIATHTRYSTDIPPLPAGADSVEEFLFGSRVGYCEQISTALAVMLRTLGVPTREAVGYVPGPYDPVTDLYQVEADDAHAWVEVWFPSWGWVDFDPTASVPDANPSPGATALRDLASVLAGVDWARLSAAAAGLAATAAGLIAGRRLLSRRRWPPERIAAARLERAGRRAGRPRTPAETLTEYARALGGGWPAVAAAVESAAYGGPGLERGGWQALLAEAGAGGGSAGPHRRIGAARVRWLRRPFTRPFTPGR